MIYLGSDPDIYNLEQDYWTCKEVCENYVRCDACPIDIAMHRLAAYEDTGLEPEEIEELKEKGTTQKMHKPNPNVYCCPECSNYMVCENGCYGSDRTCM